MVRSSGCRWQNDCLGFVQRCDRFRDLVGRVFQHSRVLYGLFDRGESSAKLYGSQTPDIEPSQTSTSASLGLLSRLAHVPTTSSSSGAASSTASSTTTSGSFQVSVPWLALAAIGAFASWVM